eukprot:1405802-Pleurochrysis_carterae.AAC.2
MGKAGVGSARQLAVKEVSQSWHLQRRGYASETAGVGARARARARAQVRVSGVCVCVDVCECLRRLRDSPVAARRER